MSHICFIQIPEKASMKQENWMYHRVSPIEILLINKGNFLISETVEENYSLKYKFGRFLLLF